MAVPDRLDVTLRLVRNAGRASLADLAARLGVSEMTVRRDLDALQARGLVERVRGGAVAVAEPESAAGFTARAGWQAGVKERIGRAAAAGVAPGATVLLDAGTTTVHVARALADRAGAGDGPFTCAAVSLPVADALADRPGIRLLVVGGESRPGERSLSGPLTAAVLRQLTVDLFVMSIGAVDARAGWSEFTLEDAAVKQVGLQQARASLVVADASKLGVRAFASVAPLSAVGRLVTDASARDPQLTPAAQDTLAALDDAGVEVDLA
ncbi:DeoR family transcriptional regulator [Geodermatophilus tzadiensis]|uniref:DeoR family transcriptional regulator n=1 Tax=Geodermatophilus tzadiensis TaxID=1137988 RepID=A0A2T0T6C3_9ACTN|nr:DeoR/GlpR family DNA-binding transcription regulator [Geodermatophilus tzadiensis]PRY41191.1 DeoR family transcriptional regulator [Geodermatophilus tzadiensis]